MKILDSKKDVYDFIYFQPSPTPVYNRHPEIITDYELTEGFKRIRKEISATSDKTFRSVSYCKSINKENTLYVLINFLVVGTLTFVVEETFDYKTFTSTSKIIDPKEYVFKSWFTESTLQEWLDNSNQLNVLKKYVAEEIKEPIVLFKNKDLNGTHKDRGAAYTNIHLAPYTKGLGDLKLIYQEIETFLSNKDKDIIQVGSDKVLAEQKGFDKYSFRKPKSK